MAVVVIGGQASGVGKTSAICGLIAAMPERRWTAIKITQCSHRDDAGKLCDCEMDGRTFAIGAETYDATPPKQSLIGAPVLTDSARYLAAGAVRALWVRTLPGHLGEAMPHIEEEIARAENVVIESNSAMEFLRPEVYAMVMSPDAKNFKPSALRHLNLADAILMASVSKTGEPHWPDAIIQYAGARFSLDVARRASPGFFAFVRRRLGTPHGVNLEL